MNILGVRVDNLPQPKLRQELNNYLKSNRSHLIITPNPEIIVAANRDESYKNILNKSDLSIPDGKGLTIASRFLFKQKLHRTPGVNLMLMILSEAVQNNKSIFLLGGRGDTAKNLKNILEKKFPGLNIVGAESGGDIPNPESVDPALIKKIKDSQANILFVAFGHGLQEKFLHHYLPEFSSVQIGIGVGGAFDFLTGNVARAPKVIQKLGFEWLFRFIRQPWRWRRIINALIIFPFLIITKGSINSKPNENNA